MPLDTDANVATITSNVIDVLTARGSLVNFVYVATPADLVALGWGPWTATVWPVIALAEISLEYIVENAVALDADLTRVGFGARDFRAFMHRIEAAVLGALSP